MDNPGSRDDFGATRVDAFEAIKVASALLRLHLHLIGMDHHSNSFVSLEVRVSTSRGETKQGLLGVFDSALADVPPRRFWGEDASDEDRKRPDPLDREGDTIGPFSCRKLVTLQRLSIAS